MDRSGFQGLPPSLPGCPASSKMLILNAQISHQYSRAADLCSIFLNCIKWCHLGSWSMIDAPCMVAVVTSSPSRCLQPFNSAWGQRGNEVLQGRKIRSVVVWVSGCFEFPILKGDIKFEVAQEDAWCLFGGCSHRAGGGSTGSSGFITRKVKPIATLCNGRGYSNATLFIYRIGIWQM